MRKMKYLAAANQIDQYMESALMGDEKSAKDADYKKIKDLLKIQKLCLELAEKYDKMDDAAEDTMRFRKHGGGSGEMARDFRHRPEHSELDCGYPNRSRSAQRRSYGEMRSEEEKWPDWFEMEDRRGRRGRSESDGIFDNEHSVLSAYKEGMRDGMRHTDLMPALNPHNVGFSTNAGNTNTAPTDGPQVQSPLGKQGR